jgi:hypothetical protein
LEVFSDPLKLFCGSEFMRYGSIDRVWCLTLFTLLCLPTVGQAQSVEGQVTWAGGEAVVAAKTTLLDASYVPVAEGVTDGEGRYRLQAPSAGEYIVVVAAQGYPNQMSDPVSLTVGGAETHDVVLANQRVGEAQLAAADTMSDSELLAAAIAQTCQARFMATIHGIVFGVVRDEATGTPLPDADIVVDRENPYAMTPGSTRLDTQSDSDGVYLICTAPAGEDLRIRGIAEGTEGEWANERLEAGRMRRVDLEVPLYDPNRPASIIGRVRDQDWGQEIRGVDVTVQGTNIRVESDMRGNFRIPELPWGEYTLVFDHPSYGHHEQTLRVIGGKSHDLEVHLPPQAIEMPAIIVRVRPRRWYGDMVNLQDRIDRGVGYIMTRKEIDARQPLHLADVLRAAPGVDVVQSGSSVSGSFNVRMRNAQNMLGQTCPPGVWVDGVKWRDVSSAYTNILGIELEVVEIYNGPAEVPGEFLDSDARCGAVIVWTRRGRTFGGE